MTSIIIAAVLAATAGVSALEGEADDKGNFVLTAAAEKAKAEAEAREKANGEAAARLARAKAAGWGAEPLGPSERKLFPDSTLKNKPVFRARPSYKPGLKVAGPGVKLVITYEWCSTSNWKNRLLYTERKALANELAWHVRKMCDGADVEIREWFPKKPATEPKADETTVIIAETDMAKRFFGIDFGDYPTGTSFLKRKGSWFLVGGNKSGRSHALTYLLEAMGCRYLWPSEDHHGKVVPSGAKELFFPELDWTYAPAMKMRGVRVNLPKRERFVKEKDAVCRQWLGISAEEFYGRWQKADVDEGEFNRGFWAWHGVLDENTLDGDYKWGHAFTRYWEWYGMGGSRGEHLEFFGLQADGSRDQGPKLGAKTDRATLCLSNRALIEETAKNICDDFARLPEFCALSIALNDGGPCEQCMCENCRKLDPLCARKSPNVYPRLTDRVMWFNNEVAKLVRAKYPNKKLCFQAYSTWSGVPTVVPPNDMLAVHAVIGDYMSNTNVCLGPMAAWSNFGVQTFWRPNLLWGFRTVAPQNFSRLLFRDLEYAKANHCVGTDFDCYYDRWSQFGVVYYALAKAMLNPDALSYDDVMDDYYRVAFGPAAPAMKKYWETLERTFYTAVEKGKTARERRGFYRYQRNLEIAPLEACFAEARRLASGDPLLLKRIAYFESALPPAKIEKRIVEAYDRDDLAANEAALRDYYAWVKDESLKDMPANNPVCPMDLYFSPCANWLEWNAKEKTGVAFDEKHYKAFYRPAK